MNISQNNLTIYLHALKSIKVEDNIAAICGNFYAGINTKKLIYPETSLTIEMRELLYTLFRSWPKFSGEDRYPVPGINGYAANEMYCMSIGSYSMWFGPYGELRKELLLHMISMLEKEICISA